MYKHVPAIFVIIFIILICFLHRSVHILMEDPNSVRLRKEPILELKENITRSNNKSCICDKSTVLNETVFANTISNNKSYICDKAMVFNEKVFANVNVSLDRAVALQAYCFIVPTPRKNWTHSIRYSESDVDFVIFTGKRFYQSRATATRDTWLSRVSNFHFLGASPYPSLPITVVTGAGENYLSNMKKIFYGLQIIYKQQQKKPYKQRQKWFYVAGCDTYVNVEHILKRLDPYDHTQPLLIGGFMHEHESCRDVTTKKSHRIIFPSGAGGIFFSSKLLEIMQPHLSNYIENVWPGNSPASDVALTCLAQKLGVKIIHAPGFWIFPPLVTLRYNDGRHPGLHSDPEPNNFHYINPPEMYVLDEFYIHQYVDRLINDANWSELSTFIRRFIVSHYQILAKKTQECASPSTKS